MKTYKYNTGKYFTGGFNIFGYIIILFGLISLIRGDLYLMAGIVMVFLGIIFLTSHYVFEISPEKKMFREFVWVLGINTGKFLPYDKLDFIYLNENRKSQTSYSIVSRTTVLRTEYDGYLRLDNGENIHLINSNNYDKALKKLHTIAKDLNLLNVVDNVK
jgi:hypothetical protein